MNRKIGHNREGVRRCFDILLWFAAKLRNEVAPILTEDQRKLIGKFVADQDQAVGKFLDQVGGNP